MEFSYREARSGATTGAIILAIVIETVAFHFAIATRHPLVAWALTLTSLWAVVWLVRDYHALGTGRVTLDGDRLQLAIGRRNDLSIPRAAITRAIRPTFRDLPAPGTTQGRDYLNLTKPAAPNVLITLERPATVRLPAGMRREVRRIALKLDDPVAFLSALQAEHAEA